MDMLIEKGVGIGGLHCNSDDANKTNKAKQRHVQINNSFEHKSRLKKHYEPLEIQVTFNNHDDNQENKNKDNKNNNISIKNDSKNRNNNNHNINIKNGIGDTSKKNKSSMKGLTTTQTTKDEYICTPSPDLELLDTLVNKRTETDDVANLLARIHRKDDDTVHLLTSRVQLLSEELDKRNSIIFSLLKTLDFVINQDISTVRTNKQLNQYLNNNKEVYIKDVISSSRWNANDTNDGNRISEDDWQMDLFQYMKNHINNIDTILLPANESNGDTDIDDDVTENGRISYRNGCTANESVDVAHTSCCHKHKLNTLPPPKIPPIDTEPPSPLDDVVIDDPEWPPDTIALVGDNLLHGIDEKRLGGKNWNVKVRIFPESHVSDFFHYVQPIMHKRPTHLVLHVGTNDAPHFAARDIYDGIMSLKNYVEKHVPTCKVIVSKPIIRMDNCQANLTILKVNQLLDSSKILTIDNGNFGLNHLSKKGPNLNPKGTARLAMNIISQMKSMLNEPTGHAQVPDGATSPSSARLDSAVTSREDGSPRTEPVSAAELFFRASKLNPAAKSFNPLPSDLDDIK